jgi:outer membrane receptor for ferrienterochelin and colicins
MKNLTMKNTVILFVCLIPLLATAKVWAQTDCDASVIIPEADRKYRNGNFDEVFEILNPCLKTRFSANAQVQGYKIVAMSYLALDSLPQAAAAVRSLLMVNQNYEPEFSASAQFKELVIQQKDLQERIIQITSVSKKAENLQQVPATVTVLTKDDIIKRGYRDLTQMLSDLPGFDVIRGNGPGYVVVYQRGYRSTGNDRTILLVDGVEENDLSSDNIQFSRQYALSDIERVEVIYGPASTMYGANAFVGVINLVTVKHMEKAMPEGKKVDISGNGSIRYASLRTGLVDGSVTARTKDIAVTVTGRYFRSDELDLSVYPEWNYDARQPGDYLKTAQNITGKAANGQYLAQQYIDANQLTTRFPNSNLYAVKLAEDGRASEISLTEAGREKAAQLDNTYLFNADIKGNPVQYNDASRNWLFRTKIELKDFTISLLNWKLDEGAAPWYTNKSRIVTKDLSRWVTLNRALSLNYNKFINDNLQFINLTSYRLHELKGETNLAGYTGYYNNGLRLLDLLNEKAPTYSIPYYYRVSTQLRNETRLLWTPVPNLDINSGLELRNSNIQGNYITSFTEIPDETGRIDSTLAGGDNFRVFDLGIFSQATYSIAERLKVVAGGRLDYNRIRSSGGYGAVFNPRLAVIYYKKNLVFKGIYAEAFKDASYLQKYATNSGRLLNNPTLRPERVKNLELSLLVKVGKGFSVNLVGYHANYSNTVGLAQAPSPTGSGTTTQFQALGKQRINGLQAEAKYDNKMFSLWSNFTYTSPMDLSKEAGKKVRVSDIADWMMNIGGVMTISKNLSLSVTNNYVSARKTGLTTSGSSNPASSFPAIYLLNSALTYNNLVKGLSLQLQASNILNNEYFVPGTRAAEGVANASRFPQERRTLTIALLFDTNLKLNK